MLASLPFALQILILGAVGLAIGVFINWAIYTWAWFQRRSISPWMKPTEKESSRKPLDFVPIVGWPGRARDKSVYGRGFWIRPMLIEIIWMIGLPWFYLWLAGGGLVEQVNGLAMPSWLQAETWFVLYSIFLGLMTIGTFIDFDEKIIPDEVTLPGTLIALAIAAAAPWSRLPEIDAAGALRSITYAHPNSPPPVASGQELAIVLAILAIWMWALMPKLPVWYCGWKTSIRFMYAHAFRPKRKTKCQLRTTERSLPNNTLFLCSLLALGSVAVVLAWLLLPPINWQSLYGSFQGLAFGGAMIWSIRIIGTYALQKEAMGFGDVTLMAMIGATLGWQATLVAFVCAMLVVIPGLLVLAIVSLFTGNQELPFGPYLCAGAALAIFFWYSLWPRFDRGVFQLGDVIWWILGGSLVLMALMLVGLQGIKNLVGLPEEAES